MAKSLFFQRSQQSLVAVAPSVAITLVVSKLLLLHFSRQFFLLYISLFSDDHFSFSTKRTRLNQTSLFLNYLLISVLAKEWAYREMKNGSVARTSSLFKGRNNLYASPGLGRNWQNFSHPQWCYISMAFCHPSEVDFRASSLLLRNSFLHRAMLVNFQRQFGKDILELDL